MRLTDLPWPAIDALSRDTPVVFPIAALEQHGGHMPLFTDSLLCGEIIRRVEEKLADKVIFAPLQWLGNSEHHLDFPGTLTAAPRTYLNLLNELLDNFIFHGFKRLIFINGHGGNDVPGKQAVFEARQRHRQRTDLLLLFATYWSLGGDPRKSDPTIHQDQMGHACEWETSMMLRIRPELVGNLSKLTEVPFGNPFSPASRGWITKDRTVPGHIGSPQLATAEKGETIFQVFSEDVVQLLERVLAWDGQSWNG
jgi:creatinine amidohydrolase